MINISHPIVEKAIEAIKERASIVSGQKVADELVGPTLKERLDNWQAIAQKQGAGRILGYKEKKDGITVGLLEKAGPGSWGPFTCLNSLRDVEPSVNLILDDRGLD